MATSRQIKLMCYRPSWYLVSPTYCCDCERSRYLLGDARQCNERGRQRDDEESESAKRETGSNENRRREERAVKPLEGEEKGREKRRNEDVGLQCRRKRRAIRAALATLRLLSCALADPGAETRPLAPIIGFAPTPSFLASA